MSEYRYHEFQAIDRPLSPADMSGLQQLTTRATIMATRLPYVYHRGDFKGDQLEVMGRYFDAFVYVANWGTHWLMLRLPAACFDPALVSRCAEDDSLAVHHQGSNVILEFTARDDEREWIDDHEAEAWMPALLPLRSELADEDLRSR